MKIECDKVLTIDDFDELYSTWHGRTLTVMGEYIKVSQSGILSRYFDTIYLFESTGIMIGFKYVGALPECYVSTQDGFESDCYVDAAPYLYQDKGKTFAIVKRSYRNIDLRKQVIGLTIIDTSNLMPLDKRYTWPMWDSIESIHNGAVLIKKGECSYGLASIDKFPTCNLVRNAFLIKQDDYEENVYLIYSSSMAVDIKRIDFTNKLAKIK